jgi:protein-L-isoaspartate(D-aspartate) O-methyltransferase
MIAIVPDQARRFLAEEIRVTANISSPHVVEALASIPRERYLPAGPWQFRGSADIAGPPRVTDDAAPSHVYHDVSIAIDPARNLYNGQPSLVARWLDALDLRAGQRVVHVGCGTGYYSALIAQIVGPEGRVFAYEVEPDLAARARDNLREQPWVEAHLGNGAADLPAAVDRILVHAGATHALDAWLDALVDGGRLLLPLTAEFPGMPAGISKGMMVLITRRGSEWTAHVHGPMPVAIYTLKDLRSATAGASVAQALTTGTLLRVTRVRRDAHEPAGSCVVHSATSCLSI